MANVIDLLEEYIAMTDTVLIQSDLKGYTIIDTNDKYINSDDELIDEYEMHSHYSILSYGRSR